MKRVRFKFLMFSAVWLVFLALAAGSVSAGTTHIDQYDVYGLGIHLATLEVESSTGQGRSYTITRKDIASNKWGEAVTVSEDELSQSDKLDLWGSITDLPGQLDSISALPWDAVDVLGWPDANSIYEKFRGLNEEANNKSLKAFYWAEKDATFPMDFVIGADNLFIAGIDESNDVVMVRRGYENFTVLKKWRDPTISPARFGIKSPTRYDVKMKDGVRLSTLVYLPDGDQETYPTILVRTRYGLSAQIPKGMVPYGEDSLIFKYWQHVTRGYAVVLQAVRGTVHWDPEYHSEGEYLPMLQEPGDGADTLEWITQQPWFDGNIGMQGSSYLGYTQWAATLANNPALKCIVPESSMGTMFSDQSVMGGTYVSGGFYFRLMMLNEKLLPGRTWSEVLRHRPISDMDKFATGHEISTWNLDTSHMRNDEYWRGQDWYRPDFPRTFSSFQISGWFDDDYPGTRSNWELMQRKSKQPQRLLLGPWKHSYNKDRKLNGFSFGNTALRDDIGLLKQKWYDRFLKGIENDVTDDSVEYFVLGDNNWRKASEWPPKEVKPQKWYFHSNGGANRFGTAGKLSTQTPTSRQPTDTYTYDPTDPVPNFTNWDSMDDFSDVQSFPYDFRDIETRQDLVTYTSPVLEEDLTIAGNIVTVLYASTDVKDTDWWSYISDVHPDGSSVRLSVGAIRARFRNLDDPVYHVFGSNFETEELLTGNPKDVVRYEISIPSIANTFKKGHRIRIAVMNAHENYSFPNSNTGEDEYQTTETVTGTMSIHHSPEHSSHVVLPVLPR